MFVRPKQYGLGICMDTRTMWWGFLLICLIVFPDPTQGRSLVLGGGSLSESNTALWDKIVELAGGPGVARIGIVTAANADPENSRDYWVDFFDGMGVAESYWIPVHLGNRDANEDPEVVSNIERMTGFFFSGGSQSRIINSFYNDGREESAALAAIRSVYVENDAVVSGSSAGVACQGVTVMITGGMSYEALRNGAYRDGEEGSSRDLTYNEDGGLGMLEDYVLDSHVAERGREGRLIRLVWDTKGLATGAQYGIGVDENTAFVIYDVGTAAARGEVIGEGGIFIPDISHAVEDTGSPNFRLTNITAHYITEGDTIVLGDNSHEVTFAGWKTNLLGREMYENALTSDDIFNGNRDNLGPRPEFVRITTNLFDSWADFETWGRTDEDNPRFIVNMYQDVESLGFEGVSPTYDRSSIAYSNLILDVEETE